MNKTIQLSLLTLAIAASLTACGGGGGGGGSAPSTGVSLNPPAQVPVVLASSIVTTVNASNYADEKLAAYTYLNSQRSLCGFGLVQQQAQLDTMAQAHTDYELLNQVFVTHNEVSGNPGFTGADAWARFTAAGYPWANGSTEVLRASTNDYGTSFGQSNVMDWFSEPFHGVAILSSVRDIGIGSVLFTPDVAGFLPLHVLTFDLGVTAVRTPQLFASDEVKTYPCAGIQGVLSKTFNNEVPAPINGRNLQSNPIGQPIYLKVRDAQSLVLTSYSLLEFGSNTPVPLLLLNKANNPNSYGIPDDSWVILMPNVALNVNSNYRFQAAGTNNGTAITPIDFTFTTGSF